MPATRAPRSITDVVTGRKIDLLDYRNANIRMSWFLILITFALVVGIGYLLGLAFDPTLAAFSTVAAGLVAGVQGVAAYWFSHRIALAASGARKATIDEHRYLVNVAEAVSIGAGVPVPEIYVIDSSAPNAFASGRNPETAVVAVTTGLIEMLDRQELEGVVAHEIAHIKNYDIRVASILVVSVGLLLVLRDMVLRTLRFGGGRTRSARGRGLSKRKGVFLVVVLVLIVLAPVLATLLRFSVSRRREYLADATGAYITRNPEGLARALEKIRDASMPDLEVSEGVQHLFFTNPVRRRNAQNLLATHPPIQERIDRLRRM